MRITLEAISGPGQGRQIIAEMGQVVSVGRTKKANVASGDNFMSGVHFAIECRATSCYVRDLKSRNGTKLNGTLITEAVLKNGDRIFAGQTEFIARIEGAPSDVAVARPAAEIAPEKPRKVSQKLKPPSAQKNKRAEPPAARPPKVEAKPSPSFKPAPSPVAPPREAVKEEPRAQPIPPPAIESYEAVTPQGRLFQILSNQPQTVMALLDAVRDAKVLELLKGGREEYQSLYSTDQNPANTPYLVRLPPRCELLRRMIQVGWGNGWGVYLTCAASVAELRQYFRTSLMVAMPDGMELFSRFYDPRFFRRFLENCSTEEAQKFFGPVTSYFMEDERPEILLEFTRTGNGVEKRGHLLASL